MFSVVQQQLRDYIVALQDVLPYVTATLTAVTYVDPRPDAEKLPLFPLIRGTISFRVIHIAKCK